MRLIWVFILACCAEIAAAQGPMVIVDSIFVEGNEKTQRSVILRELPFHEGDSIPVAELEGALSEAEKWLMNTGLFQAADIIFKNWEGSTDRIQLQILVRESWYFYPLPLFELADRNFNVWWVDHKRALNRTNFGIDFTHRNTTGHRDRLDVLIKHGYTHQYLLAYKYPYLNSKKTIGLSVYLSYGRNREVNYATIDNRQKFFREEDDFAYTRFRSDIELSFRPALRKTHSIQLSYHQNRIDNQVAADLNPHFFLDGRNKQRYLSMSYTFNLDDRDIRPYPLRGQYLNFELERDGLGFFPDRNGLTLYTDYRKYIPLGKPLYLALATKIKYSILRNQQPYNDNRAIGFRENTLHGYEYYVIDGPDMAMVNSSIRLALWNHQFSFGKLVPLEAFRKMPLKCFLSLNSDWGYVHNTWEGSRNSFNNRLLWGGGLGLDLNFYFDMVFRLEYSMNHLKETGFFLHFNAGF